MTNDVFIARLSGVQVGTVRSFDAVKGYGFLYVLNMDRIRSGYVPDSRDASVFVHWRAIEMEGRKTLTAGECVEFDIERTPAGKFNAVHVRRL